MMMFAIRILIPPKENRPGDVYMIRQWTLGVFCNVTCYSAQK
jgi:hypothetical protein